MFMSPNELYNEFEQMNKDRSYYQSQDFEDELRLEHQEDLLHDAMLVEADQEYN